MKNLLLLLCAGCCIFTATLSAREAGETHRRREFNHRGHSAGEKRRPPRSPENFRRGPGIWRAFAELPENEKKELMQLQRTDPEKFRAIMQEKADRIYQQNQQRHQQLRQLAMQYRTAADEKVKAELREKLKAEIRKDFEKRIANAQQNIDTGKKQIARMEAELAKRRANADKIVEKITDSILSGKRPNRPNRPRPNRPNRPNRENPQAK